MEILSYERGEGTVHSKLKKSSKLTYENCFSKTVLEKFQSRQKISV